MEGMSNTHLDRKSPSLGAPNYSDLCILVLGLFFGQEKA